MYWSFALVALVPPGVVTVTSTAPVPGGAVAEIDGRAVDGEASPRSAPKSTAVAPAKLVPVIVTNVPFGPEAGLTPVTVGRGRDGVGELVGRAGRARAAGSGDGHVDSPSVPAGAVAVIDVGLLTV